MSVDRETVAHIAHLARIAMSDKELKSMSKELSAILDWIEQLQEVNTDGVAPMTSVVNAKLPRREDEIDDGDCREDILANAPEADHGFFTVPKVIE